MSLPQVAEPLTFPLSSSQQRCWFVHATDPEGSALNVALRWEVTGGATPELIEAAFNGVIARHEVLRTRFVDHLGDSGEETVQEVAPEFTLRIRQTDVRDVPEERRDEAARDVAVKEGRVPFKLDQLPLLRVHMVQITDDRAIVLLTVHQIVFDGWSIRVMADEFGAHLAALDEGREPDLPELALQYGDYALWQKESLAVHGADDALYWREQMSDAPYFEIPPDFPRPAFLSHRGIILADMLAPAVGEQMEARARQLGLTPFALGYAATVAMLKQVSGRTDISIGAQVAGREEPELEPMVGVFINNLVLRVDTRHIRRFSELLARTGEASRDALLRQRMPFHRLVGLLNPPRDPARTPLISVSFTMLKEVMDAAAHGRFFLRGLPSLAVGTLYDLNLFIVKWPDGWRMGMEYNPDVFTEATAKGFLGVWKAALELAATRPDFELEELKAPARKPVAPSIEQTSHHGAAPVMPVATLLRPPSGSPAHTADRPVDPKVEQEVAAIWRDILRAPLVEPQSSFFDLGGHSLLAIRMLARVHDRFGQRLDPLRLFSAPTLRGFCQLIETQQALAMPPQSATHDDWQIVPIQPDGALAPVMVINNTMAWVGVARQTGRAHPFFGVQLFDPSADAPLEPRAFEDIAADYVKLIRAARPHGPYVLAGLCVAGVIAFEVARQLEAAGERVPLVVMADSWRPNYLANLEPNRRAKFYRAYRWRVIRRHRKRIAAGETTWPEVLSTYRLVRKSGVLTLARKLGLIARGEMGREDWSNRWFLPMLEAARDRYEPGHFAGRVLLLRSEEMATVGVDGHMGWGPLLAQTPETLDVAGWHVEMFQGAGGSRIAALLHDELAAMEQARARAPNVVHLTERRALG